jgi:uncharacterized protein (TIGR02145 family)
LPNQTLAGYGAFDATYTQRDNSPYTTTTDKYAATPTTDKEVKHLNTGNYNGNTVVHDDETTFYYGAAIDLNTLAGEYKTTITYTVTGETIPCQWDPALSFEDENCVDPVPTTMQQMTKDYCINDMDVYNPLTLTDVRNGQEYLIGKLADGNCWMLNNLKLGSTSPMTLNSTSTNLPPNSTFELPAFEVRDGGDGLGYAYDSPRVYTDAFDGGANKSVTADIYSPDFYGYYYNWCAAKGGTTESCVPSGIYPTTTMTDICPVNWRIPTSGDNDTLYVDYGANTGDVSAFLHTGPFQGTFSGYRHDSTWYNQDYIGLIWSASSYLSDPANAFHLSFDTNEVTTTYANRRSSGLPVRCILN